MFIKKIYKQILKGDIEKINKELLSIQHKNSQLQSMYSYAITSGKRFRPLLVLLSARSVKSNMPAALKAAAAIELLHKASLIHDDFIDEDDYRRGIKTFHAVYGKEKAVIMGDLLIALAFEKMQEAQGLLTDEKKNELLKILVITFRLIATGELKEELLRIRHKVKQKEIDTIHDEKTASLLQCCFEVGAMCGNASEKEYSALKKIGNNLGHVFQIINDMNNIDGREKKSKRRILGDLKQGRKNYVITKIMQHKQSNRQIVSLLKKKVLHESDIDSFFKLLKTDGALVEAHADIDNYLKECERQLPYLRFSSSKILFSRLIKEARSSWFWE